jgi:NAD(P)-dependent dehydrogenase (short-subunit alcohol dehydrogenase family)
MGSNTSPDYTRLFNLTGRTALVVGGGSGIGEAACLGLAAHGAACAVADLNAEAAQRVAGSIVENGGRATAYTLDIRDKAAVEATVGAGNSCHQHP